MKGKKRLKIAIGVLCGLIVIYAAAALWPRGQNYPLENPMRSDSGKPLLIAHGGGNMEFPDNTLEAFYNAYDADESFMMETDVSLTKDGVLILSHDTTLDRKTNVTGSIADWNYSDLIAQKVDFGYTNPTEDGVLSGEREHFKGEDGLEKYPTDVNYPQGVEPRDEKVFLATTLEELLTAFPENRINVEIKQSGEQGMMALKEAVRLLEEYDAFDRVVLASFHEEIYDEFQRMKAAGELPEEFMYSPAYDGVTFFFISQLLKLDVFFGDEICVFQIPMEEMGFDLASSGLIQAAHRHNLAVHYWTIDEPEDMRLLAELGADGIMTNYPHRLVEVLAESGE